MLAAVALHPAKGNSGDSYALNAKPAASPASASQSETSGTSTGQAGTEVTAGAFELIRIVFPTVHVLKIPKQVWDRCSSNIHGEQYASTGIVLPGKGGRKFVLAWRTCPVFRGIKSNYMAGCVQRVRDLNEPARTRLKCLLIVKNSSSGASTVDLLYDEIRRF